MKPSLRRRALASLAAVIGAIAFENSAAAQIYWNGTGTGWDSVSSWSTAINANAEPAAIPGALDLVTLSTTTPAVASNTTINLNGPQSALGIATSSGNLGVALIRGGSGDQTLSIGASGINLTNNGMTIGSVTDGQRVNIALTASQTWTSTGVGQALFVLNGVTLANPGAQTLDLVGINTGSRIDGVISDGAGTLSLVKGGATAGSVWTLNGANTFSGGVTIDVGAIRVGNASALGTGTLTINGGTLDAVGGGITLSTNNAQEWNANFTFTGTGALNLGTGAVTMDAARTVTVASATNGLTVGGVISGAGSTNALDVVKAGPGSLTLSNTGSITLRSGGQTVAPSAGLLTIAAALNTDGNSLTVGGAGNTTLSGSISAGGALTKNDAGVLILSGANSYAGGTTLNAGTLRAGNAAGLGTGTLTINGGSLDAVAAGITLSTNNAQDWAANFAFTGTGGLNLGTGAVTLAATRTVTTTANTLTVGGVISGAGGLVKAGAGTLVLTGANDYTGKVQVNAGTLSINTDAALGAVPEAFVADQLTLNGGTLSVTATGPLDPNRGISLTANSSLTLSNTGNFSTGVISGTGQLTVSAGAAGQYTPNVQNTYSGGTVLNTGTSSIIPIVDSIGDPGSVTSGPFGTGTVTFNGASFRFTAAGTTHTLANNIIFAANTTFVTATGVVPTVFSGPISITNNRTITQSSVASYTFSNVISDGGGNFNFTKAGTGQLILTGLNTYGGITSVTAGNLTIGNVADGGSPSALGQSGSAAANLLLGNGTTLQYIGEGHSSNRRFTINGTAAGHAATLNASGTGAIILNHTDSPAYGTTNQTRTLTLNGTSLDANTLAASIADNGTGAVSLTKTGVGRWVLSGTPTFTGNTTISNGTLQYANPGSASAGSAISVGAAGILAINVDGPGEFTTAGTGPGTLDGIFAGTLGGGITYASGASVGLDTTNAGGDVTISSVITNGTNPRGIAKLGTGTLILSGDNTYTGPTTVNGGTLKAGVGTVAGTSSPFGNNSAVTLANNASAAIDITGFDTQIGSLAGGGPAGGNVILGAATLTVANAPAANSTTYAGSISGTGGLTKIGTGTLILAGANTYTGDTTISGGGILVANHAQALGTTAGKTTVTGNSSLAIGSGVTITGETVEIATAGNGSNGALTTVAGAALPATWDGPVILNGDLPRIGAQSGTTMIVKGPISNGTGNPTGGAVLYINTSGGNGVVEIATPAGLNTYTGLTRVTRSLLRLGADDALPVGTVLDVYWTNAAGEGASFDLNGFNQTVGGLVNAGGTVNNSSVPVPVTVTNSGAAPSTLTIDTAATPAFSGTIIGANTSLAKAGNGTQTLSGVNTYGGTTTISAGTLALFNAGTLGTGDVVVNGTLDVVGITPGSYAFLDTQTVSGSGTILATGKPVTIPGILSPGNSAGTLSVTGDLALAGTTDSNFEILGPTIGDVDLLNVSGNLTYGGDLFIANNQSSGSFNLFDFATFTPDSDFTTINLTGLYTGELTPSGFNDNQWSGTFGDATATFDGTTGVLNLAVIPEPSTLVLGGLALLGFAGAGLRRRRQNS